MQLIKVKLLLIEVSFLQFRDQKPALVSCRIVSSGKLAGSFA